MESFTVAIDGSPGAGKTTLLEGMTKNYSGNYLLIPETAKFMKRLGSSVSLHKIEADSLLKNFIKAETYRWEMAEEAKDKNTPLIFVDTSFQHNICGFTLGYIARHFTGQLPSRNNEIISFEPCVNKIKFIKPDLNIILKCKDSKTLQKRLEDRGSQDHAAYVPHSLYQKSYKLAYKMLSPLMQRKAMSIDTTFLDKENILNIACLFIDNNLQFSRISPQKKSAELFIK